MPIIWGRGDFIVQEEENEWGRGMKVVFMSRLIEGLCGYQSK
jgi:hypothetical protein